MSPIIMSLLEQAVRSRYCLTALMACDEHLGIAKDDAIPWNNREDRALFYEIIGDAPIVCGSRTFETLPHKLLFSRSIFVFSRQSLKDLLLKRRYNLNPSAANADASADKSSLYDITLGSTIKELMEHLSFLTEPSASMPDSFHHRRSAFAMYKEIFVIGGKKVIDFCIKERLIHTFLLVKIAAHYHCDLSLDPAFFSYFSTREVIRLKTIELWRFTKPLT